MCDLSDSSFFKGKKPSHRRAAGLSSAVLAACIALTPASALHAGIMLSLSTDAVDAMHLKVGQLVTVRVELSELPPDAELVALSARTTYDGAISGVPTISGGDILPSPLADPLDFLSIAMPGAADATFLTLSAAPNDHVVSNGTFFSFIVQPQGFGPASISIVFADALQIDPTDPQNLIAPAIALGAPLMLHVVPEPSSLPLAVIGLAGMFALCRRSRR